jgi:hypothetical protein
VKSLKRAGAQPVEHRAAASVVWRPGGAHLLMRQREGSRGTPEAIARPELCLTLKRAAEPARAWRAAADWTSSGVVSRGRAHNLSSIERPRPSSGGREGAQLLARQREGSREALEPAARPELCLVLVRAGTRV